MNHQNPRERIAAIRMRLVGDTRGASFLEYLMLVGIVALGVIIGFKEMSRRNDDAVRREARFIATDVNGVAPSSFTGLGGPGGGRVGPVRLNVVNPRCFGAGTLVSTSHGPRPIETIQEGDLLWSRDEESGAVDLRPVLERYVTPDQPVMDLTVATSDGGETLRPTPGHPFWVTGEGWVSAEKLTIHGELWSPFGEPIHLALPLPSAPVINYETVYNFEVAEFHTYFVGRHGVLVHNAGKKRNPAVATGGAPQPCPGANAGLPPNQISSMVALNLPLGGSYSNVRTQATANNMGGEVNHIPPWDALKDTGYGAAWGYGGAPAIWMEKEDHRILATTGSSATSEAWRKLQALYITQGKFCWAVEMDLGEIRGRFPGKYDKGIAEYLAYLRTKGFDCK
jgi:Flp pilus assembly pilin Flp